MTARLISVTDCSEYALDSRVVLRDVRRRWRQPPESFWIVADIENPTEQDFSWDVQVFRRGELLDHVGETLELHSPPQAIIPVNLALTNALPRMYGLRWLLNGHASSMIPLDFGYPEAP